MSLSYENSTSGAGALEEIGNLLTRVSCGPDGFKPKLQLGLTLRVWDGRACQFGKSAAENESTSFKSFNPVGHGCRYLMRCDVPRPLRQRYCSLVQSHDMRGPSGANYGNHRSQEQFVCHQLPRVAVVKLPCRDSRRVTHSHKVGLDVGSRFVLQKSVLHIRLENFNHCAQLSVQYIDRESFTGSLIPTLLYRVFLLTNVLNVHYAYCCEYSQDRTNRLNPGWHGGIFFRPDVVADKAKSHACHDGKHHGHSCEQFLNHSLPLNFGEILA